MATPSELREYREMLHRPGDAGAPARAGPEWKQPKARKGSTAALYTVAISSDDRFLAAGGGDNRVHVWDLRTNEYLKVRCPCLHQCCMALHDPDRPTRAEHA